MSAPTAAQVLEAVKRSGVKYVLHDGWDDPKIQAPGVWSPGYVIQHHTANGGAKGDAPSLNWVLHNTYAPIRACHFLVARSGIVHVVYALKCYHAGKGGPGSWGDGPSVPQDSMNGRAYGIEVESKGTSTVTSDVDGFTPEQFDSLARLDAVLLDLLGAKGEGRIINHRTWAPHRKNDTLWPDAELQRRAREMRARLNRPVIVAPAPWGGKPIGWLSTQRDQIRTAQRALRTLFPDVKVTGTYLPIIDRAFRVAIGKYQAAHPDAAELDGDRAGVIGEHLYASILTRYPTA